MSLTGSFAARLMPRLVACRPVVAATLAACRPVVAATLAALLVLGCQSEPPDAPPTEAGAEHANAENSAGEPEHTNAENSAGEQTSDQPAASNIAAPNATQLSAGPGSAAPGSAHHPNTATSTAPLVDAASDPLFGGSPAALPVDLLAHIPDAPYLAVVDVSAARARWQDSGFAVFALHSDVDPLLERLAEAAGARLAEPSSVTALAVSYAPETGALALAVLGSALESFGAARVAREGPVSVARTGEEGSQPPASGPPATVALGRGLPASAIAVLRAAPDASLPALLAPGFRVGWATDDAVWVDLNAENVDGWIGRGQAFGSQTLGQLNTSAPPELQAGVTLLTRWQEALWARLRVDDSASFTRMGLPSPRCGGVARNTLAGAFLLGWMDAAANDETLELRPRVPMQAQLQVGCDEQPIGAVLPRQLARLGHGRAGGAQVLLADATALLRAVGPSAGGALPFALPRSVVEASLGARPLGVDSLAAPAPIAWASHGSARAMVLPVATANALGPNTLLEGGVPRLLDNGVLISRPGSGFAPSLLETASPWRDAAELMPEDAALAVMWAPSEPWHGTEVLGIAWTPRRGIVLAGAPAAEPWDVDTLRARIVALASGGLPGGELAESQQERLQQALASVSVRSEATGWRADTDTLGPWVPVVVELGLAAWGGSIERGPITFPVTGPLSPGLQFPPRPPTNARP